MAKIKRERVKFASDNEAGAWNTKDSDIDELLNIIKANQDFLLKTQYTL
jgi:hypothetical protein